MKESQNEQMKERTDVWIEIQADKPRKDYFEPDRKTNRKKSIH